MQPHDYKCYPENPPQKTLLLKASCFSHLIIDNCCFQQGNKLTLPILKRLVSIYYKHREQSGLCHIDLGIAALSMIPVRKHAAILL